MIKNLVKSKTVAFNVLFAIVFVAGMFGFGNFQPNHEMVTILNGVVQPVGNIVLRMLTTKALAEKTSILE